MKIWIKITAIFVVFSIFFVVASYLSIHRTEAYITENIGERFSLMSDMVLHQMEKSVESYYNDIIMYTSDDSILTGLRKSNEEFSKMNNVESYIDMQDKLWIDTEKNEITPFINATIENEIAKRLRNIITSDRDNEGNELFSEIFITNAYGVNVYASGKTSDYRQNDEFWWQQARKDGKYVDNVEYDESSNVYSITIAARIDDAKGNFLGVVKVVVRFEELTKAIVEMENNRYFDNETSEVQMLVMNGKIIYSTGYRYVELKNMSRPYILEKLNSSSDLSNYFIYKEEDGKEELFGCSISEKLNWVLCIEKPTKNILIPVKQSRDFLFMIFAIILLVLAYLGMLLIRDIIRPIVKLTKTASEIGKGNLDVKTDIKREDEIGTLSESIDKMASDLKKLDQAKMDFLNMISHELKTPLTVIYAYLDIIDSYKKKMDKDLAKDLEVIRRNSKQLYQLIVNILEMARIDAGKFELILVPMDVNKKVREFVENIQPLAKNNGDVLIAKIGKLPKTIMTDEQRFEEILNNLVSNSIKFTKDGKITIEVSADDKNLLVNIVDTGVGMPEEKMKNLFQKFYQVDAGVSRKYGGTGLGLSITKQVIEMQNGKIWVESLENKGTTFHFTLPLNPAVRVNDASLETNADKLFRTSTNGDKP